MPIAANAPMIMIQTGRLEGRLKASNTPVRIAEPSQRVGSFFIRNRWIKYSNIIQARTDTTVTMYVLDGEWEFNIDALQDVFDPEAKSIADLSDYCASRDSAYYDGGIIKASRPLVSNGTDMLYSEGRRTEYPGFVFTAYDLKQGQSLITVGISYPSKEYGKTRTLRRVEELLRGIELTQPEETAGTAE